MFQWRRFQFFDRDFVKEPGTNQPHEVLSKMNKTCSASGRGNLIFGDTDGFLNMVDRDFNVTSFQAYENTVTHLQQLKQLNILLSLGTDEEITPVIKIWNLDKIDKTGTPVLMKTIKLSKITHAVTAFASLEDLSRIAVGLRNGAVYLISGDLLRERDPRQKVILPPSAFPVTGLGWSEKPQSTNLFVATTNQVISFKTDTPKGEVYEVLDERGAEANCCCMSDDDNMVLGRTEAVYFFETEGRGPCFALEGYKSILTWFRSYLIIVGSDPSNPRYNTFNIYDLRNKFIAYSSSFTGVTQVVAEWGSIFIVTTDGSVYQLIERDMQTKLESLFKKNLYPVAINLALYQNYDYDSVIEIFRRYGDHLYEKGDFDGAITQYLRTIGKLEPSYVIRKFLDAQRIHNLTSYLQALHEKNLANADHTTLLLNCYTKLKDVNKLNEFIQGSGSERKFDVKTAIKVSRQAGYYEHALYLAQHSDCHELYLKILLEDVQDYDKALDYIATLPFLEAEKNLKKYGKTLVTRVPEPTTKLLMRLCTIPSSVGGQELRAQPEEYIHAFVDQAGWLVTFLEFIVKEGLGTPLLNNTLLELYLRSEDDPRLPPDVRVEAVRERQEKAMALLTNPEAQFDIDHALVLVQTHNFPRGLLYLYEQLGLFNEIVQFYMEHNDSANIIRTCRQHGDSDPNLWVQALTYFASQEKPSQEDIAQVLNSIDRSNILPPLLVLQILSQNKNITLSVVKSYITQRLNQEIQLIAEDRQAIRNYNEETEKMKNDIEELRTGAKIFQLSKCSACTSPLDLPAVHFLCMHSFHLRCLGENEKECPLCAANNRKIIEIQASLEDGASKHEDFFQKLEKDGKEGFYWVSEYFGRGLFNPKSSSSSSSGAERQGLPPGVQPPAPVGPPSTINIQPRRQ